MMTHQWPSDKLFWRCIFQKMWRIGMRVPRAEIGEYVGGRVCSEIWEPRKVFSSLSGRSWGEVQMCEIFQWPLTRSKDDGELSWYSQHCTVDQHVLDLLRGSVGEGCIYRNTLMWLTRVGLSLFITKITTSQYIKQFNKTWLEDE